MRSAKVTNQPCPPPCASPRFFLAIACFPDRRLPADQAGTGSPSSLRCFSGKYASNISRTSVGLLESRIIRMPSMISVRLVSSSSSLPCSLSAIGRQNRFATSAPYSVASSAVAMNGPSLEGSVMLANICTMPISVPITIADRAIDLLAFVEMGEEVVAIALEIVADELGIVAVGDEANALGQERVLDL